MLAVSGWISHTALLLGICTLIRFIEMVSGLPMIASVQGFYHFLTLHYLLALKNRTIYILGWKSAMV
jgi:hypothetical protein